MVTDTKMVKYTSSRMAGDDGATFFWNQFRRCTPGWTFGFLQLDPTFIYLAAKGRSRAGLCINSAVYRSTLREPSVNRAETDCLGRIKSVVTRQRCCARGMAWAHSNERHGAGAKPLRYKSIAVLGAGGESAPRSRLQPSPVVSRLRS